MPALKRCPFCGDKHVEVKQEPVKPGFSPKFYGVVCMMCSSMGPWCVKKEDAINQWNMREG